MKKLNFLPLKKESANFVLMNITILMDFSKNVGQTLLQVQGESYL